MGRPTKAQQAAKAAALAAEKAAAAKAKEEMSNCEAEMAAAVENATANAPEPEAHQEPEAAPEPEAQQEPEAQHEPEAQQEQSIDGKTCADCKRGKREMYHGVDKVRCPLRAFLQRSSWKACKDCQL